MSKQAKPIDHNDPFSYKNLVILDGNDMHAQVWIKLFQKQLNSEQLLLPCGRRLRIIQASWMEVECTRYPDKSGATLKIAPISDFPFNSKRPSTIVVTPHFILSRNQVRSTSLVSDKRNVLYGLMVENIPAINSLESMYMCLERPVMYGVMREIEQRLGSDAFPLIPVSFYSNKDQMQSQPPQEYPCVIKVSHAHRGMGKIRVKSQKEFLDVSNLIALYNDYCTCEPFIDVEYGIRVQKIGNHYRAFMKNFTGSGWKSQFGGANLVEVEMTAEYKLWVDECAKAFGGLDILAVDALHGKDGHDYIIELNDTAIGLTSGYWEADSIEIVKLVVEKLKNLFPAQ